MQLTIELLEQNLAHISQERQKLWAQVQQAFGAEALLRDQIKVLNEKDKSQGESPTDDDEQNK